MGDSLLSIPEPSSSTDALETRNSNNNTVEPSLLTTNNKFQTTEPNREYLVPLEGFETDCDRFSEAAFEYIHIPGSDGTVRHTVREARCSIRAEDNFAGRKTCEAKEFPHMVLIGADTPRGAKYFCSGILISNQYVLTSAHCISNTG